MKMNIVEFKIMMEVNNMLGEVERCKEGMGELMRGEGGMREG